MKVALVSVAVAALLVVPPTAAAAESCLNSHDASAPDIGVRVADGPGTHRGRVLPGRGLQDDVFPPGQPSPFVPPAALAPQYPGGSYPQGPPAWNGLGGVGPERLAWAADADGRFNDEDAAHRVAHHFSHYGGQPASAGDFNGDGIEDFLVTEHFSYVDGLEYAGEVHLYFGRRDGIDPRRHVPDLVFYGDESWGKLGLSITRAGDMNGDGWQDIAMSAGFRSVDTANGHVDDAGVIYVVFGGYLHTYGCTVKVRVEDIGGKVPGLVLEGGHDGREYTGWANGLDSGDVNGDGRGDLVIGAYDPYAGSEPTFPARAYVVFGGQLNLRHRGFRLGVDDGAGGIRSTWFDVSDPLATRSSLGFGAYIAGDLDGDGRDELAFGVSGAGPQKHGRAYIFKGTAGMDAIAPRNVTQAELTIDADRDALAGPGDLIFRRIEAIRPAGDVDGDGYDDALVTARATMLRPAGGEWRNVGAVGVLQGGPELSGVRGFSSLETILHGTGAGQKGQPAMDVGADLDSDGFADVLVNDPYFVEPIGGQQQWRGRLWLVRGGPAMPRYIDVEPAASTTFVADTRVPGMFGYTWNTGDFNGDGKPDVVVGDHYAGDRELHDHAGRVYMFLNGCSFTLGEPGGPCPGALPAGTPGAAAPPASPAVPPAAPPIHSTPIVRPRVLALSITRRFRRGDRRRHAIIRVRMNTAGPLKLQVHRLHCRGKRCRVGRRQGVMHRWLGEGTTRMRFRGWIRGRLLRPGRYQLSARPAGAAKSAGRRARFTVTGRRAHRR